MFSLGIVTQAFLGIVLTLDSWVYSLISSAYKIFMAIASARILSSDAYTSVANKVYIIVGVGMLFVLAYAILKAIIDPDQLSKGDMAGNKILKSVAVTVIGLIVTPLIFDLAYMAQGKMLEEDILGKLFFRTEDSTVDVSGVGTVNYDQALKSTGGAVAATTVWQAFFYPADGEDPDKIEADPEIVRMNANIAGATCAGAVIIGIAGAIAGWFTGGAGWVVAGAAVASCVGAYVADSNADQVEAVTDEEVTLTEAFAMASSGESFAIFQAFIEPIEEGKIKYTWFVSTVCGIFVAYAFASYAIDMGLRAAKLAYYQIIAPIPLILNVMPKNGDRLGKFVKAVFSTFLEVFVRISIVYIVIYIIAHLNELFSTVGALWNSDNLTNVESMIAMALLIIGLVLFAKQAPKIISDTFGLSAGSGLEGLNIMKKLRDGEVFTAGSIAGSSLKSGVQNATRSWRNNTDKGRGFGRKLLGAAGSFAGGSLTGAGRAGVGRARSGKPVASARDARDIADKTARELHDKRQKRDDFNRVNDTMDKKFKAMKGAVSSKIQHWAVGDVDTGSIDRQAAAFDYMKDMAGKLEGTVGNDDQIKAANRYIATLGQMNADQLYAKVVRDRFNEMRTDPKYSGLTDVQKYNQIARELGFADSDTKARSTIEGIITNSAYTVSESELENARNAADERLKTAKKDAVSRKLAEAHLSGKENDTSRMARQLLSSQEFLKYAAEFDQLEFDGTTFGQYLSDMFGDKVTVNGTVDFAKMFNSQSGLKDASKKIEVTLKPQVDTGNKFGFGSSVDVKDIDVTFDLEHNRVDLSYEDPTTHVVSSKSMTIADFQGTGAKIESTKTDGGANKNTAFGETKDKGESKGDKFRKDPIYISMQARKREAEKNKNK